MASAIRFRSSSGLVRHPFTPMSALIDSRTREAQLRSWRVVVAVGMSCFRKCESANLHATLTGPDARCHRLSRKEWPPPHESCSHLDGGTVSDLVRNPEALSLPVSSELAKTSTCT